MSKGLKVQDLDVEMVAEAQLRVAQEYERCLRASRIADEAKLAEAKAWNALEKAERNLAMLLHRSLWGGENRGKVTLPEDERRVDGTTAQAGQTDVQYD